MSNLYGYSDYNGPSLLNVGGAVQDQAGQHCGTTTTPPSTVQTTSSAHDLKDHRCDDDRRDGGCETHHSDLDGETNPLQVGFWMDGDSLAPPCGSSIPTIHDLLEFAQVCADDVVYDFGCGDGRVCLEAFALYKCKAIGVEVETDLVERARHLLSVFANDAGIPSNDSTTDCLPQILNEDLRVILRQLVDQARQIDALEITPGEEQRSQRILPLPTVIVLYLLPEAISVIEGYLIELLQLLPKLRILCNTWGITSMKPLKALDVRESTTALSTIHLYTPSCVSP